MKGEEAAGENAARADLDLENVLARVKSMEVRKHFPGYGTYTGTIVGYDFAVGKFAIEYDDGDKRAMGIREIAKRLVDADTKQFVTAWLRPPAPKQVREHTYVCVRARAGAVCHG